LSSSVSGTSEKNGRLSSSTRSATRDPRSSCPIAVHERHPAGRGRAASVRHEVRRRAGPRSRRSNFEQPSVSSPSEHRLVAFLGSTSGNLAPIAAHRSSSPIWPHPAPGTRLLLARSRERTIERLGCRRVRRRGGFHTAAFQTATVLAGCSTASLDGRLRSRSFDHSSVCSRLRVDRDATAVAHQTVLLRAPRLTGEFASVEDVSPDIARISAASCVRSGVSQRPPSHLARWWTDRSATSPLRLVRRLTIAGPPPSVGAHPLVSVRADHPHE